MLFFPFRLKEIPVFMGGAAINLFEGAPKVAVMTESCTQHDGFCGIVRCNQEILGFFNTIAHHILHGGKMRDFFKQFTEVKHTVSYLVRKILHRNVVRIVFMNINQGVLDFLNL